MLQSGWAVSVLLYMFWVFATVLLPIPRFGISAAVAADAGLKGSGLWVDDPHRLIAAGAGYFLSQAFVELREPVWVRNLLKSGSKQVPNTTD